MRKLNEEGEPQLYGVELNTTRKKDIGEG